MKRYDIFEEMQRMHDEMDRVFSSFFGGTTPVLGHDTASRLVVPRRPQADVYETDEAIIAQIDLPGVKKEDIELNLTEHGIEVRCESRHETQVEDEKKGIYRLERSSTGFYRNIPLPDYARIEDADAKYEDGVLKIAVPKDRTEAKKRRIDVK